MTYQRDSNRALKGCRVRTDGLKKWKEGEGRGLENGMFEIERSKYKMQKRKRVDILGKEGREEENG